MGNVFKNLDWSVLTGALASIIPALICITFHELSHGFVAYKLGDTTAKDMGRLTLNPIKHIDIFGLVSMAIFGFGWAKPVPVNMMKFKRPKRYMAITALAGPVSNIILASFMLALFGLLTKPLGSGSQAGEIVLDMIERTAYLSVALAIFNFIPIPPLDGSKVLFSLLPDDVYYKLMRYERYGMIILILILTTNVFDASIGRLTFSLFEQLFKIAQAVYNLVN